MIWPDIGACRKLIGKGADALSDQQVTAHPDIRMAIADKLKSFNSSNTASSMQIARALLLDEPPSAEENEITDKGYVNQRLVQARRADLVAALFSNPPGPGVITL